MEAERQTGIKSIHKVCRGEGETIGGFIWKYKIETDDKEIESAVSVMNRKVKAAGLPAACFFGHIYV